VNNISLTDQIEISPNPFDDEILINYNGSLTEINSITILNITGNNILNILTPSKTETEFTITGLNRLKPGIYFIQFFLGNEFVIKKAIKK
jgi:hypothetical protein